MKTGCNFVCHNSIPSRRDNLETKNVVLHNIHVVYEECMVGVPMDAVRVNTSEVWLL